MRAQKEAAADPRYRLPPSFVTCLHPSRVGQVTAHTLRPMGERVKVNLHTRPSTRARA